MENSNEIWETDLGGQICETTFEVLTQWIADGTLLPQDRIRRGNLRWIEAGKVPSLYGFFNARELGISPPPINKPQPTQTFGQDQVTQSFQLNNSNGSVGSETENIFCVLHSNAKAAFLCEVCANYFCQDCPQKSGNEKVSCPICGANCQTLNQPVRPDIQTPTLQPTNSFTPKPPFERPTTFSTQNFPITNSQIPIPEITKPAKSSGAGIFAIIVIALLFSGTFAYFWAYHLSVPDEEAEKVLPKIVALEEKLKTEKEEEDKKWDESRRAAKMKREAEIALQNTSLSSSGSGSLGCFKAITNESVPCDPSLQKFNDSMNERNKGVDEAFKQFQSQQNAAMDQFSTNFRPPSAAQEIFIQEKKKVIDEYRQESTKQRFLLSFIVSFVVLFGLLLIKRKFSNR